MSEQHPIVKQAISVLVIDDEPSIVDALNIILTDSGYRILTAGTGREGLELANGEQFDVVITDLLLPDISGLDVLINLRKQDAKRPVIIITAHSTPEMVSEAKAQGVFDVLAKPFPPSDFLNMVRAALNK